MNDLILFRGLPGAGKSSLAAKLCTCVVAADDFFMHDGQYQFDPKLLPEAHQYCQNQVQINMEQGQTPIAVANTFCKEWEFEPYLQLAQKYGYRVHTIIVENRHGSSNQHGVPSESIENMRQKFQIQL